MHKAPNITTKSKEQGVEMLDEQGVEMLDEQGVEMLDE